MRVRTQEVLHAMGVSDALLAEAKPLRTVELYMYRQRMGQWQLDGVNSPHSHHIIKVSESQRESDVKDVWMAHGKGHAVSCSHATLFAEGAFSQWHTPPCVPGCM